MGILCSGCLRHDHTYRYLRNAEDTLQVLRSLSNHLKIHSLLALLLLLREEAHLSYPTNLPHRRFYLD